MDWVGWIVAAVLLVVVLAMAWRQRQADIRFLEERSKVERRARIEAKRLREQAEEAAEAIRSDAERLLEQAQQQSRQGIADLDRRRQELEESITAQRAEIRKNRAAQERWEARLHEREDRLVGDFEGLRARAERIERQRLELKQERDGLHEISLELEEQRERVAGITRAQARDEIMSEAKRDARLAANSMARDIEAAARRDADRIAQSVIVTAIQRCAAEQTNESVVTSVGLPTDEMKGRIIGREGRNIRAFEQITGVNVLIDDTPEAVLLSSFDPVRRETARLTMVDLIADGRIHPVRIEEVYEKSKRAIGERIRREAEDALDEVGIVDIHPELLPVIGSLAYRTSYGQNVLRHLVESAHLAGLMAAELGLDVAICKRAAFLHDIGKALTHEHEGPHALVGADLLRRYGEDDDVVHAVEAHHNEVEPRTVEAVLTQAADAISGSRPGARRESLESYVERMENLEKLASDREGVTQAYAMQAGRELRVMVAPEQVDDAASHLLAREIAADIQHNLSYPGQIRVTVVRESRAVELAH
ncbi:MAG: ribonuclease Y [Arachnia propionica]|nr:MAG: ribonuclease Y [Arachnia propionica]